MDSKDMLQLQQKTTNEPYSEPPSRNSLFL